MLTNYIDFELTFQQPIGDTVPFAVESDTGGQTNGVLPNLAADAPFQEVLARLRADDTDEDLLIEIGRTLYNALFQGKVRERFVFTQGSQREGVGIRLKLRTFPGDTVVNALPWEYLYEPSRDNPFVLLDISVVRYPQAAVRVPNLETSLPLRVLLTAAQPSDLGATFADRELDAVRAALNERGLGANQIEIAEERHLTRAKFQRMLRQGFQIWHFAGHGGFSRDGRSGVLFFEDSAGAKDAVSARELGVLMNSSGVRLILLDACESGKLATASFRSIAPALIANGTPAVIAMQFKVPEEATTAFAGAFYEALSEALPVDSCVTEGRKAVMGVTGLRSAEWGTPVVYTRAPDGILFRLPEKPPISVAQSGDVVTTDLRHTTIQGDVNIGTGDRTVAGPRLSPTDRAALEAQMETNKRVYYQLKQRQATYGIDTPASVTLQLQDVVQEIRNLEKLLGLPASPAIRAD